MKRVNSSWLSVFSMLIMLISTTFSIAQSYQILNPISQQQTDFTIKCLHEIPNSNSGLREYVFIKNGTVYGADNFVMKLKIMEFVQRRKDGLVKQNFTNVNLNLR